MKLLPEEEKLVCILASKDRRKILTIKNVKGRPSVLKGGYSEMFFSEVGKNLTT